MSAAQHAECVRIRDWCAEQEPPIAQAELARLSGLGVSKVSRMMNGTAEGKRLAADLALLRQAETQLRADIAGREGLPQIAAEHVVLNPFLQSIEAAVKIGQKLAHDPHSPKHEDRFIEAMAPAGGGKTVAAHYLARTLGAMLVDSSPRWGTSYLSALLAIAGAMGLDQSDRASLENRILAACKLRARVIVFHQIREQTMSSKLIELWLAMMEQSKVTVVVLAIPGYLDRIRRRAALLKARGFDALDTIVEQLYSRAQVVRFEDVTEGEITTALQRSFNHFEPGVGELIRDASRWFGHRRAVHRIIDELARKGCGGALTIAATRAAVDAFALRDPRTRSARH